MKTSALQVIRQMCDDVANDKARVLRLRKEIVMLSKAQPSLKGIPARHNLQRIAERQDELRTLGYLLALYEREDAAECEIKAALESV